MPDFLVRLNLGCGDFPLDGDGWINVDASRHVPADLYLDVVRDSLPFDDDTVEEVYAGHLLEHVARPDVPRFLGEVRRVLRPGGRFGVVVPDTREVLRRYVLGEPAPVEWPQGHHRDLRDLDEACAMLIFSDEQESPHRWAYDRTTLRRVLERHGFTVTGEIAPRDPRIPVPAWYQFGLDAEKPVPAPAHPFDYTEAVAVGAA